MSILQELKTIIGITTTDYDELLIIFCCILVLYIIKALFSFLYSFFKV